MKKILLYCLFCFMVMVTTGGVTVLLGSDSLNFDKATSEPELPKTADEIAMGAIMDGAMKIMNSGLLNAKGVISVQSGNNNYVINLDVKANLDMNNLAESKLHAKIDADLFGNNISLDARYLHNKVYINALNQKIKFQVSTITDTIDIVSKYLNFDLGGIEMPALDPSMLGDLLTDILLVENEDETKTVSFNLGVGALIEDLNITVPVKINLTSDNSFSKIQVQDLQLDGMTVDVDIDMLNEPFEIGVDDSLYSDFDYMPTLVSSLLKTFTSDYIDMSGKIDALGFNINLERIKYNKINKSLSARVKALGMNLNAVHVNNVTFIDLHDTKFKMSDTTVEDMFKLVSDQLGLAEININISPDIIFALLDKIDRIYFSTIDNAVCLNAEAFGITLQVIVSENEYLKKISLNADGISLELVFNSVGESFEITPPSEHYIDMAFLPEIMNAAFNTFKLDYLSMYGNINVGGQHVAIDKIKFDNKKSAIHILASLAEYNIDVRHLDKNTYLDILGKKLLIRNQTVQETLKSILDLVFANNMPKGLDIEEIFTGFDRSVDDITYQYIDNKFHLSANVKGFSLSVILTEKLYFEYVGGSYQDFNFELFFDTSNNEFNISKPEGYHIDLGFMPMLINSLENITTSNKFAFDAKARISGGSNVKDYLQFDIDNLKIDFSHISDILFTGNVAISGDFVMNGGIAFGNNNLYLDFAGLKIQMRMSSILETLQKLLAILQSEGGMSIDISTIAGVIACLDDIYYTKDSISIDIALPDQGSFTLLLTMDANGQLCKISSNNIQSAIDGSAVEFELNILEHGNSVVVQPPYDEYYMDFNSLPLVVDAILNTAKLTAFDLKGDFYATMNGEKYLTASPNIIINTQNGLEVGGKAYIDMADPKAVDYNLGLWLDEKQIHAQINNMKVKLDNVAIPDILDAVMSLIGSDMNVTGVIGMITSLELAKVTAMVKDIITVRDGDSTIIKITLDGSLLYGLADIETGTANQDVTIELEINKDNYFSRINVQNVISGENQSLNFELYLDKIGANIGDGSWDINMPDKGNTNDYIDLSGLAPVLQAVKKTSDKEYFYITGRINYPGIATVAEVFPQDVLLRINKDANNKIKFSLTIASQGYRAWSSLTNERQVNTMFFEDNVMYIRQHTLWQTTIFNSQYTNELRNYKKATLAEFTANPMYYINLMLEISLLDSFADSFGGNAIDFTNVLTSMKIVDTADKKQVTAGINIQELAGTTALSGFDLNFFINNQNGYLTELSITNFSIIGILNMDVSLSLDVSKVSGNCFDGDNRENKFVLGVINGSNVYYEGFNKSLWT